MLCNLFLLSLLVLLQPDSAVTAAWLKLHQLRNPSIVKSVPHRLAYSAAMPIFNSRKQSEAEFVAHHVRNYYEYAHVQPSSNSVVKHATSVSLATLSASPPSDAWAQGSNAVSAQWPPHLEAQAQVT